MSASPAKLWSIRVASGAAPLAARAAIARSLPARMIGLLGRRGLGAGEGLVLLACRSVHTWFMQFPIDVIFADREWRVVAMREAMPPWQVTPLVGQAQAVIELPAGTAKQARLAVGDTLVFSEVLGQTRLDTP